MKPWSRLKWLLFGVVILDYLAQVPYYVVNDLLAHGNPPSVSSVVLLGLTLAWFLVGFFGFRAGRRFGFWVLLSFLFVEGSFYLVTIVTGTAALQLVNPNPVNKIVFMIGYATGLISLLYFALLIYVRARQEVARNPCNREPRGAWIRSRRMMRAQHRREALLRSVEFHGLNFKER